jgi:FixJ family two-component response regulator
MNLPVILATGMAPANIKHLRLSAILTKPFSTTELLQKVEEVLQDAAVCRA